MKLDCYTHIFPLEFFNRMEEVVPDKRPIKRWLNIPVLYDVDARLRMMEQFGEYQQVLTLSAPPIEYMAGPDVTPGLARLANDGMAALCRKHPDRFPAFIASLPLNNMPETLKEIDRSIKELDARGIQIFSNINGKPLDEPEFYPMFEKMAQYDLPIWLHPARGQTFPDYKTEQKSFYEIWFVFGWPYETSAAMARIVFSGIFDKLPNIKIITHHMGAMAPYFEGRVGTSWDQIGTRDADDTFEEMRARMKAKGRRPIDYFKMFYADTALFGAKAATVCGLEFFGKDKVVFASDCPFDPEGGPMYIRETIKVMDELKVNKTTRKQLYLDNTRKLLKLK
jgi:predicted TIM-barrel fold metal-dependent hydrolase